MLEWMVSRLDWTGESLPPREASNADGHPEISAMLVDSGADINACNGSRFGNALQIAAYMGNTESVKLLTSAGADLNRQGPLGTAI
jgi:ankyrin repeat protein